MLPKDVQSDLKRMNLLNAPYQAIVRYLKTDAARWSDHQVAQQHIQKRFAVLPGVDRKPVAALFAGFWPRGRCRAWIDFRRFKYPVRPDL